MFVFCVQPSLFVLSRSPPNIHHPLVSSTRTQFEAKHLSLHSAATYRRPPTGVAIRHNYGVLNRHDDTSVRDDIQNASEAYSVYPLLLSEWPEKWRFVCCWIIITTGIYETHQAFSQEECRVWRWLRAASHQTADTVKQGFQTSCLLSPSLLNHHHSSQLYDRSHDISPVRAAAYAPPPADNVTMSLAAGRARLMLLFPVIKRWLPCCCVKRHLNCQLGLGDVLLQGSFFFLSHLLSQWCGQLNFSRLQSARSGSLDWRVWQHFDSAVCLNVVQLKLSCLHLYRPSKLASGYV